MMRAFTLLASLSSVAASERRASLTSVYQSGGDVRAASLVGPLPGIAAASYAGWWQVGNPADDAHLFTWYWPALNSNASAPLLVWLQGGPGGKFGALNPANIAAQTAP